MRWAKIIITAGTVLVVTATAACGAGDPQPSGPEAGDAPGAFPVTIEHRFGTTTIPAEPQRIVALGFEEDPLSQLGLTTVGHADNFAEPGQPYSWQQGVVNLSGSVAIDVSGVLNLEQIAGLRPDLILAIGYSSVGDSYDKLSAIAPTVAYRVDWSESPWQEVTRTVGRAVGRSTQADETVTRVEQLIADLAAELPGLRGKTFTSAYYYEPGKFAVNDNPNGHTAQLYGGLGMVLSPRLAEAVSDRSLSLERIDLLDADMIGVGFANDQLRTELTADPLYRGLQAVQDGRVTEVDVYGATAGNNPTALNVPWLLQRHKPVLEKVAAS